ncbi:transglutaminase family protein [Maricaulis sp. CAU 1757]
MRLAITHQTRYAFDEPVPYGLQQVRLRPITRAHQTVHAWTLTIDGGSKEVTFRDQHMNEVDLIRIDPESRSITLTCEGEVETGDHSGIVGSHVGIAPLWYFRRVTKLTGPGPRIRALAEAYQGDGKDDIDRLHDLSATILQEASYQTRTTHSGTTGEEALESGQGVCQDHAHILISAARLLGYPARYVSGYLMMNDRVEQEASHAWAEVFVDDIGWVGFDVSNGISPDPRYVKIATGLDYEEAAPVAGVMYGGGEHNLDVTLQVQQ